MLMCNESLRSQPILNLFFKTLYRQELIGPDTVIASIRGWLAHISYGDTWALAEQILAPVVF